MMNQLLKSSPPKTRLMTGMIRSLTSESTSRPKAAPMMTPTARSTTLPLIANSRNSFMIATAIPPQRDVKKGTTLDGCFAGLAGADAHHLFHRGHEYFAIADLACAGRFDHSLDRPLDKRVADDHFDLHLGQKIDDVLGAAVELGVPFLASESLHFGDGQPGDSDLGKRFSPLVELERLDDCFDLLHGHSLAARIDTLKITLPDARPD